MNKYLRWGIIIAATGGAGYFIYTQVKKHSVPSQPPTPPVKTGNNNSTPPPTGNTLPACSYPLKKGSKNECVKTLQLALMQAFGFSILPLYGADGSWGNETEGAVQAAIGRNHIDSDSDLNQVLAYLATFTIMKQMGF